MLFKSVLLSLAISLASAQSEIGRACGFKMAPCPFDMECVPDRATPYPPPNNNYPGHCQFKNKYDSCGGFTPRPHNCKEDFRCRDDPRLPPNCGMACDIPGICIPNDAEFCGGFAGFACPQGRYCYDALDDCDPENGGADCGGICL